MPQRVNRRERRARQAETKLDAQLAQARARLLTICKEEDVVIERALGNLGDDSRNSLVVFALEILGIDLRPLLIAAIVERSKRPK